MLSPSSLAGARRPRRIAVPMLFALVTGFLAGCDAAPQPNRTPWNASITEPLGRLQLGEAPEPNYRTLTYVRTYRPNWGRNDLVPANGMRSEVLTREVTRVTPTHVLLRTFGGSLDSSCHTAREEVIALASLATLGSRTTQSDCRWFPGFVRTEWQQSGRLFPAAVGNSLTAQRAWTNSDGTTARGAITWRVESVHEGITLNRMQIGGRVFFVRAQWDGGKEEFFWSELLGHWVVATGYDGAGAQTHRSELLAASGVQPRVIGGTRAELQGSPIAGPPQPFEAYRVLAAFQERAGFAPPVRLGAAPGTPPRPPQTEWYYCADNLYFLPTNGISRQEHLFYEWLIEVPPGKETIRVYRPAGQGNLSEVRLINVRLSRDLNRLEDSFQFGTRDLRGHHVLRTWYEFSLHTAQFVTSGIAMHFTQSADPVVDIDTFDNQFQTHVLPAKPGGCAATPAPRIL